MRGKATGWMSEGGGAAETGEPRVEIGRDFDLDVLMLERAGDPNQERASRNRKSRTQYRETTPIITLNLIFFKKRLICETINVIIGN